MLLFSLGNLQGKIGRIGAPGCKGDPGDGVSLYKIIVCMSLKVLIYAPRQNGCY